MAYSVVDAMFLPSLAQNASFGLIYAVGFLDITSIPAAASGPSYTGAGCTIDRSPRPPVIYPGLKHRDFTRLGELQSWICVSVRVAPSSIMKGFFSPVVLLGAIGLASAAPRAHLKRQTTQLRESYDFVVIGGGTAGLTVADRISEPLSDSKPSLSRPRRQHANPEENILVVEYGAVESTVGVFDPPRTDPKQQGGYGSTFEYNSLPSPALDNRTAYVVTGKVVGGSSAVNGQFFDRPSRFDFDTWDQLQDSDEANRTRWTWNSVYPYFRKSVTFFPPPANVAVKYGFTWDMEAFGYQGPVYSSLPPFQWADTASVRQAWTELGNKPAKDCHGGTKDGLCWIPVSQNPYTGKRSHAGIAHYSVPISTNTRFNYDLLVKHQVIRVVYPRGDPKSGPPLVEIKSLDTGKLTNVTVKGEVIVAAGAFGTAAVLQRSGIGPASFLKSASIPVVLDLPGVGANLQDHSGAQVGWACKFSCFSLCSD